MAKAARFIYWTAKHPLSIGILAWRPAAPIRCFSCRLPSVPPDGYQQADLVISDQTVIAWQQSSGQNPAFYLLYVMNPEGEAGFYLYDTQEGTIQRYADRSVELSPTPTPVVQKTLVQTGQGQPGAAYPFWNVAGAVYRAVRVVDCNVQEAPRGTAG